MVYRTIYLFVVLMIISSCSAQKQSMVKVMTYNIRLDTPSDGDNNWHHRKEAMVNFIEDTDPDIFGIQEGLSQQVAFLDSALINYASIGVGRDDGISAGEFMSIYYKKDKINLINSRTVWLSPTPEEVSKGWDAACYRTCTIADVEIGGDTITMLNTHFDHQGKVARANSVKVIQDLISKVSYPVILTGDFNLTPDTELYENITRYIQDAADEETGTFNGFALSPENERRIDYVLYEQELFTVQDYEVLKPKVKGRQVSDHYPVVVVFQVK